MTASRHFQHSVTLLTMVLLLQSGLLPVSDAQITLDGSLGPKGVVPGPDHVIGAEVGQLRGSNLFHSFGEFNVRTGESATFTGPNTVDNVIGRVTGGHESFIDGQLRSEMPKANLYLLNPSGVLFGPNASLDVKGSFHVSTADYLKMADGAEFHADLGKGSTLSAAPPEAFGFLSAQPTGITVQGSSLQVPEGKGLSIIGGNIEIVGGSISAPSGQINVASVASPGEVNHVNAEFSVDSFKELGEIHASQGTVSSSGEGGGKVLIKGGRLIMEDSLVDASTLSGVDGKGINVHLADDLTMNGGAIFAATLGDGRAGDINVEAKNVALTGGAEINTTTIANGRAGNMTVSVTDSLSISGQSKEGFLSGLVSNALSDGDAGHVFVSAPTLKMEGGVIQALTVADGNAGEIQIKTAHLTLAGGAQISSSSGAIGPNGLDVGKGHGGNLSITATDSISLSGRDPSGFPSGIFTETSGSGDAGNLSIATPVMTMDDGRITSATLSDGRAGDLTIAVGDLSLIGGAQIASASGSTSRVGRGQGGNLTVMATGSVTISGHDRNNTSSGIFSTTFGSGNAGNIAISASTLRMENDGEIQAGGSEGRAGDIDVRVGNLVLTQGAAINNSTEGSGQAGNISITATDLISISGQGSEGFSSILSETLGRGRGGNIELQAKHIELRDGGTVSAISFAVGDAGRIFIFAPTLVMDRGALIDARTIADGNAGGVEVKVGSLTLTAGAQIGSGSGIANIETGDVVVGKGRGGNVSVAATDSIFISGRDSSGIESGIFSQTGGPGDGGFVSVSSPKLILGEGTRIGTDTGGDGAGGDIVVTAESLAVVDGAQISSESGIALGDKFFVGRGQGGDVRVEATQITLNNGGIISAKSSGTGNAGNVEIHAADAFRSHNGLVTTDAQSAQGGQIALSAGRLVQITGQSQVTTSVRSEAGDAGKITIAGRIGRDPNDLTKFNIVAPAEFVILDGKILATAVEGRGGNINIAATEAFLTSTQSETNVRSERGISGTIDIQSPVTAISGAFAPLPETFLSTAELLGERCAERLSQGRYSSFVLGGRESVPPEPGSFLLSPLPLEGNLDAPTSSPMGNWQTIPGSPQGPLGLDSMGRSLLREGHAYKSSLTPLDLECAKWRGANWKHFHHAK